VDPPGPPAGHAELSAENLKGGLRGAMNRFWMRLPATSRG